MAEFIIQLRITGPDKKPEVFLAPSGVTTIGRQEGNGLRLDHALISRQHAQLQCAADGCQITDLGSANGTLVDGERIAPNVPVPLAHGAVIEIGPFRLVYEQIPVAPAPSVGPQVDEPAAVEPDAIEPPSPPSFPPASLALSPLPPFDYSQPPPGLRHQSDRLIHYLPGIYHNDFTSRFLGIFEAILSPIEWNVDNFDLFLSPGTTPDSFLPWLANWFELSNDSAWNKEQQRTLLSEAGAIYARRGTHYALSRMLEIYTGRKPEIIDLADDLDPFTFVVKLPIPDGEVDRTLVEQIIDMNKPAHTNYKVEWQTEESKPAGRKKKKAE